MNPGQSSTFLLQTCKEVPVIPVLEVTDDAVAEPLAAALIEGGLHVIEITLRTSAALQTIEKMARLPGCVVGAGSILKPGQAAAARSAGAEFGVSPGSSDSVVRACRDEGLPLLPGAVTASEIMSLLDQGFSFLKFFPAEAAGGYQALKALSGPLPQAKFCPTGGINLGNARQYLALDCVVCVGGSWVVPGEAVRAGNWKEIRRWAAEAYTLNAESGG